MYLMFFIVSISPRGFIETYLPSYLFYRLYHTFIFKIVNEKCFQYFPTIIQSPSLFFVEICRIQGKEHTISTRELIRKVRITFSCPKRYFFVWNIMQYGMELTTRTITSTDNTAIGIQGKMHPHSCDRSQAPSPSPCRLSSII